MEKGQLIYFIRKNKPVIGKITDVRDNDYIFEYVYPLLTNSPVIKKDRVFKSMLELVEHFSKRAWDHNSIANSFRK